MIDLLNLRHIKVGDPAVQYTLVNIALECPSFICNPMFDPIASEAYCKLCRT